MSNEASFPELVHEAFIVPMRSVLIVDDQYPTWEEILNSQAEKTENGDAFISRSRNKTWIENPSELLKIIHQFRSTKPGFVIDIHDALASSADDNAVVAEQNESPSQLADHLHQSDLLVLDYNLEGEAGGLRGKKAREILHSVLTNKHFNLIIIHTGEDNLDEVMGECLLSLMQSCSPQFSTSRLEQLRNLDACLDDLEIDEKFDRSSLTENFDIQEYLEVRQIGTTADQNFMRGDGKIGKLKQWGESLGLRGGDLKLLLFWAIREFEKIRLQDFSSVPIEELSWRDNTNCKWLRTSRGFVTFVKKGPSDLLGELKNALVEWQPTPSRLLSAKYRHALSSIGVEAEDKSLLRAPVFAEFYDSIRKPAHTEMPAEQAQLSRMFKLKEHVSRQSEAVSYLIQDEVVKFGEKIVSADEAGGGTFARHYGIDLSDEGAKKDAINQYNNYVSTLPMKQGQDQLDSGHIFKLGDEWWLCATPACDLQPGQTTIAFKVKKDIRVELRPFTAILLVPIKLNELQDDHINSGSYCFVENDEKVICLGLRSISDEKKPSTQKVTWRTLLALEQGLITDGILKVLQPELIGSKLETSEVQGRIVAKLRYEYALNYIQRVGASVSRIGLGYVAYTSRDQKTKSCR